MWRLLHGEIDEQYNPKIWWLILGTNDLAIQECSEEVVLLGILRVIEEIMTRKPKAIIVANSILPMTLQSDGLLSGNKKDDTKYYDIYGPASPESDIDAFEMEETLQNEHNNPHRKAGMLSFQKKKEVSWSSVSAVNKQLKEFCDKNGDNVHFFDADKVFIEESNEGAYIKSELLNYHGHPTAVRLSMQNILLCFLFLVVTNIAT